MRNMLYRNQELRTPSATVRTPTLFPVRNIGKRSSDNTPSYHESISDLNTAMVNSFAIHQHEDLRTEVADQGIHELIGFDGVVFADSGGFDLTESNSPPESEKILRIQERMEADIWATLDLPLLPDMSEKRKEERKQKNIEFALEASESKDAPGLLYASVHGHDPRTIRNSINYLEKHGEFDGFALGGLVPLRTDYSKVIDLVLAARTATDKPLHVFGLGGLLYQPLLMYLGVDTFDSTAFIRCGSHRRYFVPGFGDHNISDFNRLEQPPCPCPVCSQNTLSEVRESRNLVTKHNLWALVTEVRRFKWMIEIGEDVENYLDLRYEGNDVTKRAFNIAKQRVRRLS
jgi:queuine/archaeosine tRNA-ribosyltransferase